MFAIAMLSTPTVKPTVITLPVTVITVNAPTVGNLTDCSGWKDSAVGGSYRECKVTK